MFPDVSMLSDVSMFRPIDALDYPVPAAQIRAAGVLDTQPPLANEKL
jgi:hypothetical protein